MFLLGALVSVLLAPPAHAGGASALFEVRVDLRGDRAYRYPTVEVRSGEGAVLGQVFCSDDGQNGDTIPADRLFVCRGEVAGEGPGKIVLIAGSGGQAEQELDEVAFTYGTSPTVRWSWRPGKQSWAGAKNGRSEEQRLAREVAGQVVGGDGASSDAPPGPPEMNRPEPIFGQPVLRDEEAPEVRLPRTTTRPPWFAWLAAPGAVVGVALLRALAQAGARAVAELRAR